MPEMPEVEAVTRRLREEALGAVVAGLTIRRAGTVMPQRVEDVETLVKGQILDQIERRGKNILLHFEGGVLRVHLRMTGNLYVIPDARFLTTAVRAVFTLADGRGIVFDDPRALGRIHAHQKVELEAVLGDVGMEPLSEAFTVDALQQMAKGSRKPAKLFLMDQKAVSGLGNIYAAEALFLAGISPLKPVGTLRRPRLARLHAAITTILRDAVHSVYLTYSKPGRLIEAEQQDLKVYGREGEPCRVCGRAIRRIPQGGRSTYYCAGCQT